MAESLKKSIYMLRDGLLYKSCPSCSSAYGKHIFYNCPELFGYRHDENKPYSQSLCLKCRGRSSLPTKLFEGHTFLKENDLIIPAIRILPMSKEIFPTYSTVKDFFLKTAPSRGNTYYYKTHNLVVEKNTLILFQYDATIIAYAIYESEQKIDDSDSHYLEGYNGYYKFINDSIKFIPVPINSKTMFEQFSIRLSQATSNIKLSYFPVLMEFFDDTQNDIIEEENKNIETKTIQEINNFSITGIHTFNTISHNTTKDYIRAHKNQMAVGRLGEELVLKYEKERLNLLGKFELSKQVKIVSENSSLGYDILSYDTMGQELHIEVKSKAGMLKYLDFYISDNEYQKLKGNANHLIYYISHLRSQTPFLFKLDGSMINENNIKPVLYRVTLDYEINENF